MPVPSDSSYGPEAACAVRIAAETAELLRRYAAALPAAETKEEGELVSVADREADVLIRSRIEEAFPGDGLLTEEGLDDGRRLEASRVWVVDPLDGTRDFLAGSDEFSVHVALTVDGAPVVGVVAAPMSRRTWLGMPGTGAWVREDGMDEWSAVRPRPPEDPLRVAVTRRELDANGLALVRSLPSGVLHRSGSAGLKAVMVADGSCDLYPAVTRRMGEWDLCAPHAVAAGAGCSCTDLVGDPLVYNRPDVRARRGFMVATPGLLPRIRPMLVRWAEHAGWL